MSRKRRPNAFDAERRTPFPGTLSMEQPLSKANDSIALRSVRIVRLDTSNMRARDSTVEKPPRTHRARKHARCLPVNSIISHLLDIYHRFESEDLQLQKSPLAAAIFVSEKIGYVSPRFAFHYTCRRHSGEIGKANRGKPPRARAETPCSLAGARTSHPPSHV